MNLIKEKEIIALGIETSCDETAAAIVKLKDDESKEILANVVFSQIEEHAEYGGVVPEIAARSHLTILDKLIMQAMQDAGINNFKNLSAVAATAGPGLIGGVMVGLTMAKAISMVSKLPFLAINHLEGHALTARLTDNVNFPYLLLLVSGGHSLILIAQGIGKYKLLGTTIDDAIGEAFDKTAKILGLGYPGGIEIEKMAKVGNKDRFQFPRPLKNRKDCNLSFSGLKTAVRQEVLKLKNISDKDKADICAGFQKAAIDCLTDKIGRAMKIFALEYPKQDHSIVIAGGVASNISLRAEVKKLCQENNFSLKVPPINLCTDNGAMIAWAGIEKLRLGRVDQLDFAPKARWPL